MKFLLTLEVLVAVTFVYGTLRILTTSKLFDIVKSTFLDSFLQMTSWKRLELIRGTLMVIDNWLYNISLIFQAYYWIFIYNK